MLRGGGVSGSSVLFVLYQKTKYFFAHGIGFQWQVTEVEGKAVQWVRCLSYFKNESVESQSQWKKWRPFKDHWSLRGTK